MVATETGPTEIAHLTTLAVQTTKTIAIVIEIDPIEIGPTIVIAEATTTVAAAMTVVLMTQL